MRTRFCFHALAFAVAAAVCGSSAWADVVIDPLSGSGGAATATSDSSPAYTLDSSGLSASLASPGTTAPIPTNYPTQDNQFPNRLYRTSNATGIPAADPLVYNLNLSAGTGGNGAGYNIDGLYEWNYNEFYDPNSTYYDGRGIRDAVMAYSTNGGSSYTPFGTVTFPEGSSSNTDPGSFVSFGTALSGVTNIEFSSPASNYNWGSPGDGSFTGLGELRFLGVAATPEPGSLLLLAFAGAGLLLRARKPSQLS